MREVLFSIGSFKIYGYGLMIAIGIILAFTFAEKAEKNLYPSSTHIYHIGIWGVIGGFLGAKILFWITEYKEIINDPKYILETLSSGFVVYGGIVGGILAGVIYCRTRKISFFKYFDIVMPAVALAQGFGRLGCLLAGCCYGKETNSAFGIVFSNSSYAPNGIKLVPTQIIFSAADFVNATILSILLYKKHKDGTVGGCYLIFYSVGRFLLEFLRADYRGNIGFLSTSQFIAIFTFITGICIVIKNLQGDILRNNGKNS